MCCFGRCSVLGCMCADALRYECKLTLEFHHSMDCVILQAGAEIVCMAAEGNFLAAGTSQGYVRMWHMQAVKSGYKDHLIKMFGAPTNDFSIQSTPLTSGKHQPCILVHALRLLV